MRNSEVRRWTHPTVILVATDLSDIDRLMETSLVQARETGAHLLLFHVVSNENYFPSEAMGVPCYDVSGEVDRARAALKPWCLRARAEEIRCDVLVREGHPAVQIVEAIRQFRVDRVLLGTRGRGRFSKLLLGSVAEQVLRSVYLPVITVGPEAHLGVERDAQNRAILLATTLRETSLPGAALACQIASARQAPLVLLHVLPGSGTLEPAQMRNASDINALRELHVLASKLYAEFGSGTDRVEVQVSHGTPCDQILAAAAARNAGMIVLSASHHFALHTLTHDRTVYRVLAHAACPVLTLLEPAAHSEALDQEEILRAS